MITRVGCFISRMCLVRYPIGDRRQEYKLVVEIATVDGRTSWGGNVLEMITRGVFLCRALQRSTWNAASSVVCENQIIQKRKHITRHSSITVVLMHQHLPFTTLYLIAHLIPT